MNASPPQIRSATVEDARAVAQVHVDSWLTTYQGILPQGLLDGLSVDQSEEHWRDLFAKPSPDSITLVACGEDGRIVGFACGGKERSVRLAPDGELYAIYLRQDAQGRGIGTRLVRRLADHLIARNITSMAVWVLDGNPFKKFYERLGGVVIADQQIERGGQPFKEIAYGWMDLATLARPADSAAAPEDIRSV